MRDPMTHRLKQLHIEMKALKERASSGTKLTKSEQAKFDQLVSDYREALTDSLFHTY
jgi:hypothetical protein